MFEVRNEDGQVVSRHDTNEAAQEAARRYRLDREMGWSCHSVFGPIHELNRQ